MEYVREKVYRALRWSEQYTKTDMVYLASGGFWLTLGQALSAGSSFVVAIAFANLLPKDAYGIYKYILTLVGVLSIATLRTINVSITQSVAQGNEGTALAGIKTKMKWGLLGSAGAILLGGYYLLNGNHTLSTLLFISSFFLPLKDSLGAYVAILNGKKDFRRIATYGTITALSSAVATTLVLLLTKNIFYLFFVYSLIGVVLNYVFFKKTLSVHRLNNIVDQESVRYGTRISWIGNISSIAGYVDKLLTFHFLGAVGLAVYSIAQAPIGQINSAVGNINSLASPKFSQLSTEELLKSLKAKEKKMFLVAVAIVLVYIAFSEYLFSIFFPQYHEAVFYSQLLALSVPFISVYRLRITAIHSRFAEKVLSYYTPSVSAVQIVLLFLGGYFHGLLGIVVANLVVNVLQFIATSIILRLK